MNKKSKGAKDFFYAHGKYFDNEEEFIKFCKEWLDSKFDLDEFKKQMDYRVAEILLTYQLRKGNMTNRIAYKILRSSIDWAVKD